MLNVIFLIGACDKNLSRVNLSAVAFSLALKDEMQNMSVDDARRGVFFGQASSYPKVTT